MSSGEFFFSNLDKIYETYLKTNNFYNLSRYRRQLCYQWMSRVLPLFEFLLGVYYHYFAHENTLFIIWCRMRPETKDITGLNTSGMLEGSAYHSVTHSTSMRNIQLLFTRHKRFLAV